MNNFVSWLIQKIVRSLKYYFQLFNYILFHLMHYYFIYVYIDESVFLNLFLTGR